MLRAEYWKGKEDFTLGTYSMVEKRKEKRMKFEMNKRKKRKVRNIQGF